MKRGVLEVLHLMENSLKLVCWISRIIFSFIVHFYFGILYYVSLLITFQKRQVKSAMISQDLFTLWLVLEVSEEESEAFHYYLVSVSKTKYSWHFSCLVCKVFSFKCHHHHVALSARISLTLSHHPSLLSIASSRSSGLHPVSAQSCCL